MPKADRTYHVYSSFCKYNAITVPALSTLDVRAQSPSLSAQQANFSEAPQELRCDHSTNVTGSSLLWSSLLRPDPSFPYQFRKPHQDVFELQATEIEVVQKLFITEPLNRKLERIEIAQMDYIRKAMTQRRKSESRKEDKHENWNPNILDCSRKSKTLQI